MIYYKEMISSKKKGTGRIGIYFPDVANEKEAIIILNYYGFPPDFVRRFVGLGWGGEVSLDEKNELIAKISEEIKEENEENYRKLPVNEVFEPIVLEDRIAEYPYSLSYFD